MSGKRELSLSLDDLAPDPLVQFRLWYEEAESEGLHLVNAIALATADADGVPSARHVLLRGFDERGFTFYTNYESRKGHHLAENTHAAFTLLWKELDRQICVIGTVGRTEEEESDAYFRARPREAQIGAWASKQSTVIAGRDELMKRFAELDQRYPTDVPRPSFWGGFRLAPDTVEFWQARAFRLHDRFRYTRDEGSPTGWLIERLSP